MLAQQHEFLPQFVFHLDAAARSERLGLRSFTTLFRHALIVLGHDAPVGKRAAVQALSKPIGFDASGNYGTGFRGAHLCAAYPQRNI